jgi:replicative DNA helicase
MTPAKFITAADVARSSAFDPDAPAPPRYRPGPPFDALDVRPGRVLLVGAPPGAGKTALVLQVAAGVLGKQPDVHAVVGNVEMSPEDLLVRVMARLAGLSVERVADKTLSDSEKDRLRKALDLNQSLLDRLAFLEPPYTLDHLAGGLADFGATLAVVDYVQRFGAAKDLRESLDGVMSGLRRIAAAGAAVIAVSSVARQKDGKGRSAYSGLGLASFRGSAELEFGSDSAYILDTADGISGLRCVKNRYGQPTDVRLRFSGEFQQYSAGDVLDAYDTAPGIRPGKGAEK